MGFDPMPRRRRISSRAHSIASQLQIQRFEHRLAIWRAKLDGHQP